MQTQGILSLSLILYQIFQEKEKVCRSRKWLERVGLCGLNFVQIQSLLITAQGCRPSGLSQNPAPLPHPALTMYLHPCRQQRAKGSGEEPEGQRLYGYILC